MKKGTKENGKMNKILAVILILGITAIIYASYMLFTKNLQETTSAASIEKEQISYALIPTNTINIDEIIEQNRTSIKEEIIKKEIDLEYTTSYMEDSNLPKGMIQVLQEGIDGKQIIIMKKTYENDELIKEEQMGSQIIKSSVNKMVTIGTGAYTSNYTPKVGDNLYVTSQLLAIRIEPNDDSEKIITISKNNEVKLLAKEKEWYQIQYQSYIGWSKAECLTYLNPNAQQVEEQTQSQYTKQQLLNKLSFNMQLNKPSGLSLEQFKKIFANDSRDKKKIFENNAQYFYYAEKQYNVNGVFIAAVAIHESGWGGSAIASDKNNLFGYGAYDRNPYNSAYSFSSYAEGIDLLARVFAKYYLNPPGTTIYDGNKADGCYYHGATLSGVNVKYATDKNWANGVYSWMKYLYNRL